MPLAKPSKRIPFIVQEKTEPGVKKKELESVDLLWEDPQQQSVKKKKQAKEDERIRNAIEGKFGTCVNEDSV